MRVGDEQARYRIPFSRPTWIPGTEALIEQVIAGGRFSASGSFGQRCEARLAELLDAPRVFLTNSCSSALAISALLLGIEPGDEVVVPSFTFPTSAGAFVLRGARPVFADIRPDTLSIDEDAVAGAITDRTRVVVAVHYGGIAANLDRLLAITESHGLDLVEDNAHGLFGTYRGRPLGSFGRLSTLSFHETKNVSCGEGGALIVNDRELVDAAEVARDKGTDRRRFERGEVDAYSWVGLGSNYGLAELLAAIIWAQLEQIQAVQRPRAKLWATYMESLSAWAKKQSVALPVVPDDCEPSFNLFSLVMPARTARDALIGELAARGILAVPHYRPLHLSQMGRSFGARQGQCPVAEMVSDRLVRLPLFTSMSSTDQELVIETVLKFEC